MSGKYPRTPDEMRSGRHSMERALRIKKARAHYVSRAQRRAADKLAKDSERAESILPHVDLDAIKKLYEGEI